MGLATEPSPLMSSPRAWSTRRTIRYAPTSTAPVDGPGTAACIETRHPVANTTRTNHANAKRLKRSQRSSFIRGGRRLVRRIDFRHRLSIDEGRFDENLGWDGFDLVTNSREKLLH